MFSTKKKIIEKKSIMQTRQKSLNNLKLQAKIITFISEKRFCQGNAGESVKVKISVVNRT